MYLSQQQFQAKINGYSYVNKNYLYYYPIEDMKYTSIKCPYGECVTFYAIEKNNIKVDKEFISYQSVPENNRVIKGMSIPIIHIFKDFNYLRMPGDKSISFFKPNVR